MLSMFRYSLVLLSVLLASGIARADEAIDGSYLSTDVKYQDMQKGMIPVAKDVKIEFRILDKEMKYLRIQSPVLQGFDQLYYSVRGISCVYASLGYPVLYPGSTIKVKTRRETFEIKYDSNGKTIFEDIFLVTNLDDNKAQTYRWQEQVGSIRFDHAPLKYEPATKTYSFHVNPTFLPESYAGHYQQEGDIKWINEMTFTISADRAFGTLKLGCPDLQLNYQLKKTGSENTQF